MKWKWILCAVLMAGAAVQLRQERGAPHPGGTRRGENRSQRETQEELLAKLTVQEKVGPTLFDPPLTPWTPSQSPPASARTPISQAQPRWTPAPGTS